MRIYAYKMLDKLTPRYKAAVLALKAGDKLKDPANADWEAVTAFINSHERSETRLDQAESGEPGHAMATRSHAGGAREAGLQREATWAAQCYNCGAKGHYARNCKKQPANGDQRATGEQGATHNEDEDRADRPRGGGRRSYGSRGEQASMAVRGTSAGDGLGRDWRSENEEASAVWEQAF